jgi:hypothetical protein
MFLFNGRCKRTGLRSSALRQVAGVLANRAYKENVVCYHRHWSPVDAGTAIVDWFRGRSLHTEHNLRVSPRSEHLRFLLLLRLWLPRIPTWLASASRRTNIAANVISI